MRWAEYSVEQMDECWVVHWGDYWVVWMVLRTAVEMGASWAGRWVAQRAAYSVRMLVGALVAWMVMKLVEHWAVLWVDWLVAQMAAWRVAKKVWNSAAPLAASTAWIWVGKMVERSVGRRGKHWAGLRGGRTAGERAVGRAGR